MQRIEISLSDLRTCCGCSAWVELMHGRSFTSVQEATAEARKIWWQQVRRHSKLLSSVLSFLAQVSGILQLLFAVD